ncbi:hypothetical protein MHBO_000542 [Bonamia ostreae]|uniref:Uncharacterized protein n=1 Tax=Bonamia ostreae TaxID=126728 RepID=A0ABV2AG19_9EUKA
MLYFRKKRKFACRTEYRTYTPEPKILPKMLSIPVENTFMAEFSGTSIELLNPLKMPDIKLGSTQTDLGTVFKPAPSNLSATLTKEQREVLYGPEKIKMTEKAIAEKSSKQSKKLHPESSNDNLKAIGNVDEYVSKCLKNPNNDRKAKIICSKPIFFREAFGEKEIKRVIFNDNVDKNHKFSLLHNRDDDNFGLYAKDKSNDGNYDLVSEYKKSNDGAAPPPGRKNVLIVGKNFADFVIIDSDLRLKRRPPTTYDFEEDQRLPPHLKI